MDALRAEAGVRTPRVLPAPGGRRVVTVADPASGEERSCVRFEFLPGTEPAGDSVPHFAELGEITARMHRHARRWPRPPGFHPVPLGLRRRVRRQARGGAGGRTGSGSARPNAAVLGRLEATCGPGWPRSAPARSGTGLSTPTPGWPTCSRTAARSASSTSTTRGFSWYLYDAGTSVSFFEHQPHVPGAGRRLAVRLPPGARPARRRRGGDLDVHPVPPAAAGRLDRLAHGGGHRSSSSAPGTPRAAATSPRRTSAGPAIAARPVRARRADGTAAPRRPGAASVAGRRRWRGPGGRRAEPSAVSTASSRGVSWPADHGLDVPDQRGEGFAVGPGARGASPGRGRPRRPRRCPAAGGGTGW